MLFRSNLKNLNDKEAIHEKAVHNENAPYHYQLGTNEERRLIRKIDLHIVPPIWILYTLSYLDRANIGNAESGGMQRDLGDTSNQYSVVLLLFFVSYVIFEVPMNMLLTRWRPSIYLSGICVIWGGVAASMAGCQTWQQVAAVRFCLGIVEAGFAPGVAFYLSSWYKRHELYRRYSLYYTATAVSGAFSGLLAGVITQHLEGARGLAGWRWLLLIEGVGSSFAGLFAWMFLPDWPSTTKWLTPEESQLAIERLRYDGISSSADIEGDAEPTHGAALKSALKDWRTWVLVVMYMLATGAQTIQYFVPALVGELGYEGFNKQYMTIPIYAVAFVAILGFCFISDIRKERGHYITIATSIATVSFIICVSSTNKKVQYAFLCFAVGGVYASCPMTLMWVANVMPFPAEKRAVALAFVNSMGNSASIYGSFLWPSTTAPRYAQGFATTTVFVALLAILAQVFRYLTIKYPVKGLVVNQERSGTDTPRSDTKGDV